MRIFSGWIFSIGASAANKIIILKEGTVFCNDTVPEITKILDGKIYETTVSETIYAKLKEAHQILTVRQTSEGIYARFVCMDGTPFTGNQCVLLFLIPLICFLAAAIGNVLRFLSIKFYGQI